MYCCYEMKRVSVMVFNTTFNNISVISLRWDEEGSIRSNQKLCELVIYDTLYWSHILGQTDLGPVLEVQGRGLNIMSWWSDMSTAVCYRVELVLFKKYIFNEAQ
jgi:hypothetical protein